MNILAIETSCDDTGIAVLEIRPARRPARRSFYAGGSLGAGGNSKFEIRSNIVSSQTEVHQKYGGVFPMMAVREHQKNLVPVLMESLEKAGLLKEKKEITVLDSDETLKDIFVKEQELYKHTKNFLEKYEKPKIDILAVTHGPGLEPCLWTGVNFARALSYFWNIDLVPVNHIEGHILVNFLNTNLYDLSYGRHKDAIFPAVALVVSGGHTQLILVKKVGSYQIIGETRDDAAGECFDKAAKILGLGYPGGPIVSKIASSVQGPTSHTLPRPMINTKDYDFSFSGLKTAVLYAVRNHQENITDKKFVAEMCYEVQEAIIDVLVEKTLRAAKDYKVKTIILGGGVSANSELRSQFELKSKNEKFKIVYPEKHLSTDNGLMIAVSAFFRKKECVSWKKLSAHANLRIGK